MNRFIFCLICISLLGLPFVMAQDTEDGLEPYRISGGYASTYYARFTDWNVISVLMPIRNFTPSLPYEDQFDLTAEGQIIGQATGDVADGRYEIDLPPNPEAAAWYDTDGDPTTPSTVKVFMATTSGALVAEQYISRYDFPYTRSFRYDPNNRLFEGTLFVWAAEDNSQLPLLNGADNIFYTDDDIRITVPAGWSVVEVIEENGVQSLRQYRTSEVNINLTEPPQFSDVDLSNLTYADAFDALLTSLETTYVFTDFREVDWVALRAQFAPKMANAASPQEFLFLLESALFSFYDGHLSIVGDGIPNSMWGRLGLRVYPTTAGLLVLDVYETSPIAAETEIIPGTIITAVNDQDALSYFETVPSRFYSGGHQSQDNYFRGNLAFRGTPGTEYSLEYQLPDNRIMSATLATSPVQEVSNDFYTTHNSNNALHYEILESGYGLISIADFTSSLVDDLWDEAMSVMNAYQIPGIIIDLRNNGGGFSMISNYMLGDFLDEDVYSGREVSALDEDGDGETDVREEYYFARQRTFDPSNVVVMVGPECFSACEFAAQGFQDIGATVIGHLQTGGAGGGVGATYYLPAQTRVYGMAVVRSEDPQGQVMIEGRGVPLDYRVPYTVEGLASETDMVLEAAIAILNGEDLASQ